MSKQVTGYGLQLSCNSNKLSAVYCQLSAKAPEGSF